MTELLKLHWNLIKNPTSCLEEFIEKWSVKFGVILYLFYFLYLYFNDGRTIEFFSGFLNQVFPEFGHLLLYPWIFVSLLIGIISKWYIIPVILRFITGQSKLNFDPTMYRKITFYSPTSYVLYIIILLLPIQLLAVIALQINISQILFWILIALQTILQIWAIVPSINLFIIEWKGLAKYYSLKPIQIILVVFIIPIIFAIPFLIIFAGDYIKYLSNMISA